MHWIAGLTLAASACAALAQAPKFPAKPVRMLVGFAPGGATDIIARLVSTGLAESLGQPVVVDNRPGASSQIAGEIVAKASPGGHVPLMFSNMQAGKLRARAVTSLKPSSAMPGLPTMAESGLPGFEVVGFFGVLAPAATPRDTVTRLNGEINKVLARSDIRERFASQALDPANTTAEQFADYIKVEVGKWGKLIREAGITAK